MVVRAAPHGPTARLGDRERSGGADDDRRSAPRSADEKEGEVKGAPRCGVVTRRQHSPAAADDRSPSENLNKSGEAGGDPGKRAVGADGEDGGDEDRTDVGGEHRGVRVRPAVDSRLRGRGEAGDELACCRAMARVRAERWGATTGRLTVPGEGHEAQVQPALEQGKDWGEGEGVECAASDDGGHHERERTEREQAETRGNPATRAGMRGRGESEGGRREDDRPRDADGLLGASSRRGHAETIAILTLCPKGVKEMGSADTPGLPRAPTSREDSTRSAPRP